METTRDNVLEDLKSQLIEFEEAKKSTLKRISDIVPRLEKERKQLQYEIDRKRKQVQKIDEQIKLIESIVKYYEEAYNLESAGIDEQLAIALLKHIKGSPSSMESKEAASSPNSFTIRSNAISLLSLFNILVKSPCNSLF